MALSEWGFRWRRFSFLNSICRHSANQLCRGFRSFSGKQFYSTDNAASTPFAQRLGRVCCTIARVKEPASLEGKGNCRIFLELPKFRQIPSNGLYLESLKILDGNSCLFWKKQPLYFLFMPRQTGKTSGHCLFQIRFQRTPASQSTQEQGQSQKAKPRLAREKTDENNGHHQQVRNDDFGQREIEFELHIA